MSGPSYEAAIEYFLHASLDSLESMELSLMNRWREQMKIVNEAQEHAAESLALARFARMMRERGEQMIMMTESPPLKKVG